VPKQKLQKSKLEKLEPAKNKKELGNSGRGSKFTDNFE